MTHEGWEFGDPWTPFLYRGHVWKDRKEVEGSDAVVDGDTIWFRFDMGFYDYHITNVRLLTVDTREISFVSHDSEEYKRGIEHKEFVEEWLAEQTTEWDGRWPFLLKTYLGEQYGAYGRVLAEVYGRASGENLAHQLLDEFDDVEVYDG